jgi:Gas vesicle synthesis protein GvpL/GvpF
MMRYIYGIIRSETATTFDVEGLSGAIRPVSLPMAGGLAMVTSPHDNTVLRPTRKNMLAHTRVLETVMKEFDVLPVRFGTVVASDHSGVALLENNREQFLSAMETIQGRVELSIKIFWRDGVAFREVMTENARLTAERDRLASMDPGKSHYDRIEFGKAVGAAISAKRDTDSSAIIERLTPYAEKMLQGPITEDAMIVNLSMLVKRDMEKLLDQAINLIDDVHGKRWMIRYVGPIPAFSFVELSLHVPETDQAEEAA